MEPPEVRGFEVGPVLGCGSSAVVHLAEDRRDPLRHRRVALKVFRPGADHLAVRERGVLAALLDVPGAITAHGWASTADDRPCLVLEAAAGSLAGRAQHRALSPAAVMRVADRLLAAVGSIHATGIVHGDVKPANVLLVSGRLVLTDFGDSRPVRARPGPVSGTVAHLAPEVLAGAPPTPASDLFAVGSTLLEVLSGASRQSVGGRAHHHLAQRALDGGPRDLRPADAHPPLRMLLAGLLDPDPARRGRWSRCPGADGASR